MREMQSKYFLNLVMIHSIVPVCLVVAVSFITCKGVKTVAKGACVLSVVVGVGYSLSAYLSDPYPCHPLLHHEKVIKQVISHPLSIHDLLTILVSLIIQVIHSLNFI